jgi:hypothetical protein
MRVCTRKVVRLVHEVWVGVVGSGRENSGGGSGRSTFSSHGWPKLFLATSRSAFPKHRSIGKDYNEYGSNQIHLCIELVSRWRRDLRPKPNGRHCGGRSCYVPVHLTTTLDGSYLEVHPAESYRDRL